MNRRSSGQTFSKKLEEFDPCVVGTLPLGIALPGSDIDIVCHSPDPDAFTRKVWSEFGAFEAFEIFQWTSKRRPIVARFIWGGWPFELFGASLPAREQHAFLHFEIERRLLALDNGQFRSRIMQERLRGLKTEPAFATTLGIDGDPYDGLLALASETDDQLMTRLLRLNER